MAILFLLSIAFAQRLSPGDKIRLICEQEPTLSVERVLSPDGDVVLPIIGKVNLAGKFIVEAEDELQRLAGQKLGSDRILIALAVIANPRRPIEFTGAVGRSGSIDFRDGMTLGDIVKIAMPNGTAATEAVEITGADGKKIIADLGRGGGATKIRPGDRIFFPIGEVSNEVLILGGVAKPGSKAFKPDMTVQNLIDLAGGVTGHGQPDKVQLDRKGSPTKTIDLSTEDASVPLQRGDVVTVPTVDKGRFVTVTGLVGHPGAVEFRPGMTVTQAIKAAGGFTKLAQPDAVTVKRLGQWKHRIDVTKIEAGSEPDLALIPADIIDVPAPKPKKPGLEKPDITKPRTGPVVPPR